MDLTLYAQELVEKMIALAKRYPGQPVAMIENPVGTDWFLQPVSLETLADPSQSLISK